MRKIFMAILGLITVTALAFGAAGCGNKKETIKVEKTQQKVTRTPGEVRILYIAASGPGSPQFSVGRADKIFEKVLEEKNKKVTYLQGRRQVQGWMLMEEEKADFVYISTSDYLAYMAEKEKKNRNFVVIAGSLENVPGFNVYVNPNVKGLQQLGGKTVGIANRSYLEEMLLNEALKGAGLATKAMGGTVKVVYHSGKEQFEKELAMGKYDAITSLQPSIRIVFGKKSVPLAGLKTQSPTMPQMLFVVREDLIKKNPGLVKLVLQAHVKATEVAISKKERLPQLQKEAYDKRQARASKAAVLDIKYFTKLWEKAIPTYNPNVKYMRKIYDFELKARYAKEDKFRSFIRLDLLRELLKEQGKPQI